MMSLKDRYNREKGAILAETVGYQDSECPDSTGLQQLLQNKSPFWLV